MNEKRESCLAAILARGLHRVRQCAERTGTKTPPDAPSQPTEADQPPMDDSAEVQDQGEQQ